VWADQLDADCRRWRAMEATLQELGVATEFPTASAAAMM
jgi:hypothetical protein